MELDAGKGCAEAGDAGADRAEVVDEQRGAARCLDQCVGAAAGDGEDSLLGAEAGGDRAHRPAHAVSSRFSVSRSILPLGLLGSASRQRMAEGCMKLGSSRLRWALSASSGPSPRTTRAIASPR